MDLTTYASDKITIFDIGAESRWDGNDFSDIIHDIFTDSDKFGEEGWLKDRKIIVNINFLNRKNNRLIKDFKNTLERTILFYSAKISENSVQIHLVCDENSKMQRILDDLESAHRKILTIHYDTMDEVLRSLRTKQATDVGQQRPR